ncbi:hypothetical protein ACJRO7_030826, partial [Eucalyptus globulus]
PCPPPTPAAADSLLPASSERRCCCSSGPSLARLLHLEATSVARKLQYQSLSLARRRTRCRTAAAADLQSLKPRASPPPPGPRRATPLSLLRPDATGAHTAATQPSIFAPAAAAQRLSSNLRRPRLCPSDTLRRHHPCAAPP